MTEGLASDTQTVRWALQIDARRRLDSLLPAAVDKNIQEALVAANGKDKIPVKSKEDSKKALDAFNQKLPPEYKADALFAVDRDGRVVAQIGYDASNAFENDFELGGYPAVFDALHGFLRDDTWVLGGKVYRVVARPVEYDVTQPPAGAVVGMRAVDTRFAQEISKLTRTNVAFYAAGIRVAGAAGQEGFDEKNLEVLTTELPKLENDKSYKDTGHSTIRLLNNDNLGAVYARFDGDAYEQRAGYVVARTRVSINSPLGFLTTADEKDTHNVPWWLVALGFVIGLAGGIGFTLLEHNLPMGTLAKQAARLKKGEIDLLQLPQFRGGYRGIAQDLNAGIERVAEKGGGAPRKLADVEAIIGPLPAQPSMSAFSFPQPGEASSPGVPAHAQSQPGGPPSKPGFPPPPGSGQRQNPLLQGPGGPPGPPPPFPREPPSRPNAPGLAGGGPPGPPPPFPREAPSRPNAPPLPGSGMSAALQNAATTPMTLPTGNNGGLQRPVTAPTAVGALSQDALDAMKHPPPAPAAASGPPNPNPQAGSDEEATMVGQVPKDVMAQASGSQVASSANEAAEWLGVYEEFIRTKKQCGEPTDGLTFEKFQHTLKKNRDALIQRHGCKRVRFSVYVKEGRASLKATPVKE